ncbi:MAG: UDP-2,4-diacetamido-2,4,6-trideoxy-beta-L-altropyranose hydrolase [Candidatus Limnocylindrales bacterium]
MLVRADASSAIGTGHVMRTLALATELAQRAFDATFACVPADGDMTDVVLAAGFPVEQTHETFEPLPLLAARLRGPVDWLVLDHYRLDRAWLRQAAAPRRQRLVIDDLIDRPLEGEIIVNPSMGASDDRYAGLIAGRPLGLYGPRYAILRPEFRSARAGLARSFGQVRRVVVAMGGADPKDATLLAVRAVLSALPEASVDVLLGDAYPHPEPRLDPSRVRIHRGLRDLSCMLASTDLAVGAGGTSALERCCVGLPTVLVTIASNQFETARSLSAAGAAFFAGQCDAIRVDELAGVIRRVAGDPPARRAASERGMALVDGLGAGRVAVAMDGVRLRRATRGDTQFLWRWANDPLTRALSFHSDRIAWEDHVEWLRARLSDPATTLLVGITSQGPAGQVRFDKHDGVDEISISVAPEQRGLGIGRLLLRAALRWHARVQAQTPVRARVKAGNLASRRMFAGAGFRIVAESSDTVEFELGPRSGQRTTALLED